MKKIHKGWKIRTVFECVKLLTWIFVPSCRICSPSQTDSFPRPVSVGALQFSQTCFHAGNGEFFRLISRIRKSISWLGCLLLIEGKAVFEGSLLLWLPSLCVVHKVRAKRRSRRDESRQSPFLPLFVSPWSCYASILYYKRFFHRRYSVGMDLKSDYMHIFLRFSWLRRKSYLIRGGRPIIIMFTRAIHQYKPHR